MKTWRQDRHAIPLGGWALLCIITAFAIFGHRHGPGGAPFRLLELLAGVSILVVAPAVFAMSRRLCAHGLRPDAQVFEQPVGSVVVLKYQFR